MSQYNPQSFPHQQQTSYVQSSYHPNVHHNVNVQEDLSNTRLNKSFIDNKPMIQGLVRSVLKVQKSGEAHLINTGLTDIGGAKQIAQNLFEYYDKDRNGSIDTVKTLPILANAYRVFNSAFNPDKNDVNSFFDTLDVDKNKKVTLEDMENLCIRYLTGTTLGVTYKFHQNRNSITQGRQQ